MALPATGDALAGLDSDQRAAACAPSGALLVLAGPGAGKTRVLTHRIAWWIESGAQRPDQVLAITFTNRAADELRERLGSLLGIRTARRVTVGTFHAVCHRLLRGHAHLAGRTARFSIYDESDTAKALAGAIADAGAHELDVSELARFIGRAKAQCLTPEKLTGRGGRKADAIRVAWEAYERALADADALDFEDLIGASVRAIESDARLRAHCQARWPAVAVDEYQDSSPAQARFVRALLSPASQLTVVADDDQAVYGFRGADPAHVLAFERDHRGATVLALGANYRSRAPIVDAASALIARNASRHPKPLRAVSRGGPAVCVRAYPNEHAEAHAAAAWCKALAADGVAYGDQAVLYRTHALARPLEAALLSAGVPFRVRGSAGLFSRAEVRDALAHLRVAVNPRDRVAFARAAGAPKRGLGPGAMKAIQAHAKGRHGGDLVAACADEAAVPRLTARQRDAAGTLAELWRGLGESGQARNPAACVLSAVMGSGLVRALQTGRDPKAQERLERLRLLVRAAQRLSAEEPQATLADFLAHAALADAGDHGDGGAVTLATAHAAKGLEWLAVRVIGLEEGAFPHARAKAGDGVEEERRLAYVSYTRARERLVLSHARARNGKDRVPSRFIAESGVNDADHNPR